MQVHLGRRAKIAIRSLSPQEQKSIKDAIAKLETLDESHLGPHSMLGVERLFSGTKMFVYDCGRGLRLLLSTADGSCSIEDVIHRERLAQIPQGAQT